MNQVFVRRGHGRVLERCDNDFAALAGVPGTARIDHVVRDWPARLGEAMREAVEGDDAPRSGTL
jgi:hypothetical protein